MHGNRIAQLTAILLLSAFSVTTLAGGKFNYVYGLSSVDESLQSIEFEGRTGDMQDEYAHGFTLDLTGRDNKHAFALDYYILSEERSESFLEIKNAINVYNV